MSLHIAFIGGGNMASAIIGGLTKQGHPTSGITVVEPSEDARASLRSQYGVGAMSAGSDALKAADVVIWAVKPQVFHAAGLAVAPWVAGALHISIAAGIPCGSIATWLHSDRIVRTMPNTPALIGKGITGLFAMERVTPTDREHCTGILGCTGQTVWVEREEQLDAVTALSGSGPAYMFYLMEAMTDAGAQMGLSREQAHKLAVATFIGAGELALASTEAPEVLRQRVTSKGGTTHAAISAMDASEVKTLFSKALFAAHARAQEMGKEFGSAV
ncbi:pyrroline-5-carboxylate reductase [Rhodoferax aquaticus]|uniref:Pyrroline-5-carboxylate reductase n=1 Tax=Rhodoferax aquaticus TaxID=2527691 RepID=A0A515EKR0_9BURK|nr:pyrroline-5-carboxylate reductase [Rhodoferax aquaticus]QDL53257.1 pyrroline-5-carboxylate reductase [Rhodoferax aquaticus]